MKQYVDAKALTQTKSNCKSFEYWYRTYERGKEKKPTDVKVIIMYLSQ